jgi:hypothetical protein
MVMTVIQLLGRMTSGESQIEARLGIKFTRCYFDQ